MNGASPGKRALFLDRDGSLIAERNYLDDPAQVELLPGVAYAIARLNRAGWLVLVVTNQSGVARGYFGLDRVSAIHAEISRQLAASGAHVDDWLVCPHHPDGTVAELTISCNCRKPKPGLLLQAARRHGIDLAASVMAGDKPSDLLAGEAAGCRSWLLLTGYGKSCLEEHPELEHRCFGNLPLLVDHLLSG